MQPFGGSFFGFDALQLSISYRCLSGDFLPVIQHPARFLNNKELPPRTSGFLTDFDFDGRFWCKRYANRLRERIPRCTPSP